MEDDAKVLGELDALRLRRTAAAIAKKLADASAAAAGDEHVPRLLLAATTPTKLPLQPASDSGVTDAT